jgi:hypothetical protein
VSEAETALSTKTPIDATAWHHDTGNLATKLLLQGRTPGHELKAETIIDHREPARTQDGPLPVDTGDVLTFHRRPIDKPGFGGDLSRRVV